MHDASKGSWDHTARSLSLPELHRPKTEICFGRCTACCGKIAATDKLDAGEITPCSSRPTRAQQPFSLWNEGTKPDGRCRLEYTAGVSCSGCLASGRGAPSACWHGDDRHLTGEYVAN